MNKEISEIVGNCWTYSCCLHLQRVPLFSLPPHSTLVPRSSEEEWAASHGCEGTGSLFTAYSWVVSSISSNHEVWYGRKPTILFMLRSLKRTLTKMSGLSERPWKLVRALFMAICCFSSLILNITPLLYTPCSTSHSIHSSLPFPGAIGTIYSQLCLCISSK